MTRNDVTRRFPGHGFRLKFNTYFVFIAYHERFLVVNNGELTISAAGDVLDRKQRNRSIVRP
jgi:hypothetical protein